MDKVYNKEEIVKWIKENLTYENNIYKIDINLYKKLQYNNLLIIDSSNYKYFIKKIRYLLKTYDIKMKYVIKYIYSTYEIIYYIDLRD